MRLSRIASLWHHPEVAQKLELIGRKTHVDHARCDTGACLLVNGIRDGCIAGAVLDGDVIALSCYQILCN